MVDPAERCTTLPSDGPLHLRKLPWTPVQPRPALISAPIAPGPAFGGYEADGELLGIMGIQAVRDVDLIRHAYVLPDSQRHGFGGALLEHLRGPERATHAGRDVVRCKLGHQLLSPSRLRA